MRETYYATRGTMQETFEQVFQREHKAMIGLAYLLLRSQGQAEEAAQDAFVKLLDKFDSIKNPGGFVRTATINRCHDILRKSSRENNFLRKLSKRNKEIENEHLIEMSDILAELDFDRKEVIVLRYYLGHQPKEIAEILNIPEGTVKSRLHRALIDLERKLS